MVVRNHNAWLVHAFLCLNTFPDTNNKENCSTDLIVSSSIDAWEKESSSLHISCLMPVKGKGKGFPYSIPSVGPGADPGVQTVSLQVIVTHPPSGRLPLLSATPAVTSPAAEHHCPLAGTKLYCLVTGAHRCKQLAQGRYAALPRVGFEPATYWSQVQRSTRCTTASLMMPVPKQNSTANLERRLPNDMTQPVTRCSNIIDRIPP